MLQITLVESRIFKLKNTKTKSGKFDNEDYIQNKYKFLFTCF